MATLGFIGMGNMGYAMLKGNLAIFTKEDIIFTDVNKDRVEAVSKETQVSFAEDNVSCVRSAKFIVFAVKPQYYEGMLESIQTDLTSEHIIISIAPGISIDYLKEKLGADKRIVRAMPNTPALIGEGMSGITFERELYTEDEIEMIHKIFQSFGKVEVIEERLMNAVVAISGSAPAYAYMFIEALADSGVKYGLPRDKAYAFAAQTLKGSADMVLKTKEHPGVLKDQVCSPGGTTIAAVAALEEFGFRNSVMKAADACYNKAESLK